MSNFAKLTVAIILACLYMLMICIQKNASEKKLAYYSATSAQRHMQLPCTYQNLEETVDLCIGNICHPVSFVKPVENCVEY